MLKKTFLFLSAFALLLIASCDKNEENGSSRLTMRFDFSVNGDAFIINEVYDYPFDYQVRIENLKMYYANISLIRESGEKLGLQSVVYVDAADGASFTVDIPTGKYTGLEFSIGVPVSLNGTANPDFDASLYDNDHPLSLTKGMYWTWAAGYRFILMDGKTDTDLDEVFETPLSIHTGKDYSYRTRTAGLNYEAQKDGNAVIALNLDVIECLASPTDTIDILPFALDLGMGAMRTACWFESPLQLDMDLKITIVESLKEVVALQAYF